MNNKKVALFFEFFRECVYINTYKHFIFKNMAITIRKNTKKKGMLKHNEVYQLPKRIGIDCAELNPEHYPARSERRPTFRAHPSLRQRAPG
jgi:hypothetical protein